MAWVLDYDIVEREFKPQVRYYVPFQTNTPEKVIDSFIILQLWVKWYYYSFFYKDSFGIK